MTKKKTALLRFKKAAREMVEATNAMAELSPKELKWVMPRLEKFVTDLDGSVINSLSNLDKSARQGVILPPKNSNDDDVPF